MTQRTLFDGGPKRFDPPHNGTETSRESARRVRQSHAEQLRRQIYQLIRDAGGATDQEIQEALGIPGDTERPRRAELTKQGVVRDSGRTRPTPAGRQAIVWTITDKRPSPCE